MKGIIITEGRVSMILQDITKINQMENSITFNHGMSKLQNVNFEELEIVIDTDQSTLDIGDVIPNDFVDKANLITEESQVAIIDSLGKELTSLKMELLMKKGDGSL